MTSHELAKKLLALPESNVMIWVEENDEQVTDWQPVKSFTIGNRGVMLCELGHEPY